MARTVRVQLGAALTQRAAAVVPDSAARRLIARAARAALRHENVRDAELSVTLLDDAEITAMNREFLSHDGVTDVISFALYGEGEDPVGDVYIGCDQALRQAISNEVSAAEELARLAVHGTLHILGHDHPDGSERLKSEMWQLQEKVVKQVVEG
ncbi:MAG TPA: rRNA maturation RNase YbeY [Longimicrobiales bacterium]|nr:rRNA maturation RNase YbeY [Longimicrobiales bacterium]